MTTNLAAVSNSFVQDTNMQRKAAIWDIMQQGENDKF